MDNTGRNHWKATVVKVNTTDKLHEDDSLEIRYEIVKMQTQPDCAGMEETPAVCMGVAEMPSVCKGVMGTPPDFNILVGTLLLAQKK